MEYLEIQDGKVIGHFDAPEVPTGNQYKPVKNFNGWVGMDYGMLNEDYHLKTQDTLMTEGYINDFRGKYWDKETKELIKINELNKEPLPEWTDKEPSRMPYEHWNGSSWENNVSEKAEFELSELRGKRTYEFQLFDKYQLPLLWNGLSVEKQSEFLSWRSAWLGVPDSGEIPERLSWFQT